MAQLTKNKKIILAVLAVGMILRLCSATIVSSGKETLQTISSILLYVAIGATLLEKFLDKDGSSTKRENRIFLFLLIGLALLLFLPLLLEKFL